MKKFGKKLLGFFLAVCIAFTVMVCMVVVYAGAQNFTPLETEDYYGRQALQAADSTLALQFAYDRLAQGIANYQKEISFPSDSYQLTTQQFQVVLNAYISDYPLSFHLGNNMSYVLQNGIVTKACFEYTMEKDAYNAKCKEIDTAVGTILEGLSPSMSEYELELAIHDRLAERVTYKEGTDAHNLYGSLVRNEAVCEGYADAFQYVLYRVGIQAHAVFGTATTSTGTENHEWNLVRIDNQYYYTDLTWNDHDAEPYYPYFNVTSAQINEDHTAKDDWGYALPNATATDANYFQNNSGKMTADGDKSYVLEQLRVSPYARVYVTGDNPAKIITWYQENLQDLYTELGFTGKCSSKYSRVSREYHLFLNGSFPVEFDASGGSGNMSSVSVPNGVAYTLPACSFAAPAGKVFNGWQVGDQIYQAGVSVIVPAQKNCKIVATWRNFDAEPSATAMPTEAPTSGSVIPTTTQGGEIIRYGDVDGDKKINSSDVLLVLRYSVHSVILSEDAIIRGDVDGDKKINSIDALWILKYAVHSIDRFPCEQ